MGASMADEQRQAQTGGAASESRTGDKGTEAATMNIRTAKQLFNDYGDDFVSELEKVATVFRSAHLRDPLPNGNFLHALCLTRMMLRHTSKKFLMVTGGAGGGFIGCLLGDFRKMLLRVKKNKGEAKVIVVDNNSSEDTVFSQLQNEFPSCLKVAYAYSEAPIRHYLVADNDMVRDEELHDPLTDDTNADAVVADVYFRNPNIADLFAGRFRRQWEKATTPA